METKSAVIPEDACSNCPECNCTGPEDNMIVDDAPYCSEESCCVAQEAIDQEELPLATPEEADVFKGAGGIARMEKKIKKGKKITQQEAFTAMMEMRGAMNSLFQAVQRLAGELYRIEGGAKYALNTGHVLVQYLIEKKIFTEKEFAEAFERMLKPPDEKTIQDTITELKAASGEDAYFAMILEIVQETTFKPQVVEGRAFNADDVKDYYNTMLSSKDLRVQVLGELNGLIPDLPKYTPGSEKIIEDGATEEVVDDTTTANV